MRRRIAIAAALGLGALGLATFAHATLELANGPEAPLAPTDFAYGRALSAEPGRALQTAILDAEVYRGSIEPRLADLRVFDAEGAPVPHAIRSLDAPDAEPDRVALPLFPLPAPATAAKQRARVAADDPSGWAIDAELSATGAIVRIAPFDSGALAPRPTGDTGALAPRPAGETDALVARPGGETTDAEAAPPAGYVIDASQLERGVVALELELGPTDGDFLAALHVEGSDDLAHFETLTKRAAVARLERDGHRIERTRVAFDARRAPSRHAYLRVRSGGRSLPAALIAVRAELSHEPAPAARSRIRVTGSPAPDAPGRFVFDLGGAIPVDRLQVKLPRRNDLVRAELAWSDAPEGRWRTHWRGLLYAIDADDEAGVLRNPEIHWPRDRHRWVALSVSPEGGGLAGAPPTLEAAWRPEQLVFLARGTPPYRLAYGRAEAPALGFDAVELLVASRTPADAVPEATARLGPVRRIASDSVLSPPPRRVAPRTLALWAVLIAGVAGVLALSLRLLRDMRTSDSADGAP